jgi:putative membrane protein
MTSWIFATLHLLALGIGLGAVWARARALGGPLEANGLKRVFAADGWWGGAGFIWISTGLARLFGGFEKGSEFYLSNHLFLTKMGLLVVLLALEMMPMLAIIKWRMLSRAGQPVDTRSAGRYALISRVQAVLVILMVILATGVTRGIGAGNR